MMKRTLSILYCLLLTTVLLAEDVSFRANAPQQVIAGQPFQLTYTVNHRSKDLRAPEMSDFDILAGPYTSQSSSTSWVNGKRTSSFTQTYTYTLVASKPGSFTIPAATITVSGAETYYRTAPASVSYPVVVYAYGDANGDGKVDIVDVTMSISRILGQNPDGFIEKAADVNKDGKVDIVDVTSIIDIILKAS